MTVGIVTDSAAALPAELAARHAVTVVPMWLTIADQTVREGERTLGELLGDERVSTSGPTPGEFETAIRERLDAEDDVDRVLVLTIAASMSSTHEAAALAARGIGERARVVDTSTAAGAEALVVLAAARAAAGGALLEEVEEVARRVMDRVRLIATVPSLDHLVRSGRVPSIAGWAGRALGINPLFEFSGGGVKRLRPALSSDAAFDRIAAACLRSQPDGAALHVVAMHALAHDAAARLLDRVTVDVEPATSFLGEFGSVMVVHTGPGLVGLAWWWDEA